MNYAADMTTPEPSQEVSIREARNQLADLIGRARYNGQVTYLLSRGKRVAAIVSVADAERIEAEQQRG